MNKCTRSFNKPCIFEWFNFLINLFRLSFFCRLKGVDYVWTRKVMKPLPDHCSVHISSKSTRFCDSSLSFFIYLYLYIYYMCLSIYLSIRLYCVRKRNFLWNQVEKNYACSHQNWDTFKVFNKSWFFLIN